MLLKVNLPSRQMASGKKKPFVMILLGKDQGTLKVTIKFAKKNFSTFFLFKKNKKEKKIYI